MPDYGSMAGALGDLVNRVSSTDLNVLQYKDEATTYQADIAQKAAQKQQIQQQAQMQQKMKAFGQQLKTVNDPEKRYQMIADYLLENGDVAESLQYSKEAAQEKQKAADAAEKNLKQKGETVATVGDALSSATPDTYSQLRPAWQSQLDAAGINFKLPEQYTPQVNQIGKQLLGTKGAMDLEQKKAQISKEQAGADSERARAEEDRAKAEQDRAETARIKQGLPAKPKAGQEDLTDRATEIMEKAALAGVSPPAGTRSQAMVGKMWNALDKDNPDMSPDEIVAKLKGGQLSFKADTAEASSVGRREGNIAPALNTLNRSGGLYDQLLDAGGKIDMGDSKTINQIRLGLQGKVVANPEIQAYVTKLRDTRAELANVLARSGQVTDQARKSADEALPDTMSIDELKAAIQASKEVGAAVNAGNVEVMDALKRGGLEEGVGAARSSRRAQAPSIDINAIDAELAKRK